MSEFYIGEEERDGKPGYSVRYEGGYESWSPKDTLEKAYLRIGEDKVESSPETMRNFLNCSLCEKIADPSGGLQDIVTFKARVKPTLDFILRWGTYGLVKNIK